MASCESVTLVSLSGKKYERAPGACFIVFEGPDGSGHTTQARLFKKHLERGGRAVLLTNEPTIGSEAGRKIRSALRGEMPVAPDQLQELFVEDRRWHVHNVILPALAEGTAVISDRYFFSTVAFGSLDCEIEWLIELNKDFPLPDHAFAVLASPETCLARIAKRSPHFELFEEKGKLAKTAAAYKSLPERFPNVHVIDGEQSIEEVFEKVLAALEDNVQPVQ